MTKNKNLNMNILPLTEKYRPTKLSECILPKRLSNPLSKWVRKSPNHLIFHGGAGIGKTSTAISIAKELSPDDYTLFNASKYNSVDFIREYLSKMMSSISLYSQKRILILDEADGLSKDAQTNLRKPLEDYSHLCSVIFTYNYTNKIIEPLKSRCFEFDFSIKKNELLEVKKNVKKRLKTIIKKERIKITNTSLDNLISTNFPDMRKCVNQLELY